MLHWKVPCHPESGFSGYYIRMLDYWRQKDDDNGNVHCSSSGPRFDLSRAIISGFSGCRQFGNTSILNPTIDHFPNVPKKKRFKSFTPNLYIYHIHPILVVHEQDYSDLACNPCYRDMGLASGYSPLLLLPLFRFYYISPQFEGWNGLLLRKIDQYIHRS